MRDYFDESAYRWDEEAQAAYLSIDEPGSIGDRFVSYDDEHSCRAKVDYVRQKGIGGVIIWELTGGYLPQGQSPRDPLLQEIKRAAIEP